MKTKTNKENRSSSPMRNIVWAAIILIIAAIAIILTFILPDKSNPEDITIETPKFNKDGTAEFYSKDGRLLCGFDIEIAETPDKLLQGLMYRDSLGVNQAMLFIFDKEEPRSFWMKNTYLPLDIVYISADSTIVSISENTTPFSEQELMSKGPALYVLEINAGLSAHYGLAIGDKFSWKRD